MSETFDKLLENWDYWRDEDIKVGEPIPEFLKGRGE